MNPPSYWEDLARASMRLERWSEAAEHWEKAKGASIGHTRRDRYERLRDSCREKANGHN